VHIGDDFGSDCAPAKALRMRTIWVKPVSKSKPVVEGPLPSNSSAGLGTTDGISMLGSTGDESAPGGGADVLDPAKLVGGVYKFEAMGSGDYLAEMVIRDAVDHTVFTAAAAAEVVLRWQQEALAYKTAALARPAGLVKETAAALTVQAQTKPVIEQAPAEKAQKFCFECGVRLLRTAKFCSECGTRQPEVS
jgi:hypothetical protein